MKNVTEEFETALLSLNRVSAKEILIKASENFLKVEIAEKILVTTLGRIGQLWEDGSIALAQVYMSGRICEELVNMMFSGEKNREKKKTPKIAAAVLCDYHFLGMRMVTMALKIAGFELIEYGHQDVDTLVQRANEDNIDILLISTLMLPAALKISEVRKQLNKNIKILVGGAPFRFDEQLWKEVGADGVGLNAFDAIDLVIKFSEGKK